MHDSWRVHDMKALVFSARPYDRRYLDAAAAGSGQSFEYTAARLDHSSAAQALGVPAVCCFVDDRLDADVLVKLAAGGTRFVLLRSTGSNNVDLDAARRFGLTVARVAGYSPYAVAEFAVGLMLALNRKIHRAYNRVREGNFLLDDLLGFDLHGRTVGVVGTGRIGSVMCRILAGFGCKLLATDPRPDAGLAGLPLTYTDLDTLLGTSDIVTLHAPLTSGTHHLLDEHAISRMKQGAMLINTSRGGLVETKALVKALKSGRLGAVGLDVYEEEEEIYYQDFSSCIIPDDLFERLITFPNVIVTGHQAFFTHEALVMIAAATVSNMRNFEQGTKDENVLIPRPFPGDGATDGIHHEQRRR